MAIAMERQPHEHDHSQNRFAVLPTAARLDADAERTGKGVTIAFLDSGFYPHPDLTTPTNRVIAFHDVTRPGASLKENQRPEGWDWHGTQTSVVAAGNGQLSEGVYRGLASEAQVVLVKVSDRGRITEENIERGIRWVIENKDRYNIRVLSISLGGDEDMSHKDSRLDQAAEEAVRRGLVIVVAAGNSGAASSHAPVAPANSPYVITVGGYDDKNSLGATDFELYWSSFGPTADGIIKPEIIAPAIWVAAPILPETTAYAKAEALSQIASAPDYLLNSLVRLAAQPDYLLSELAVELWHNAELSESLREDSPEEIRATVESQLKENKIVATHYQHVDGTSFAAPIVASVAAQMIEANPDLTPAAIKHILISTATRIPNAQALRQGYGMLNARRSVREASREYHASEVCYFCPPRLEAGKLIFTYHDDAARSVSLAGDFNGWNPASALFAKQNNGVWIAKIEPPARGRYGYKFVVDETRWIDDPANASKEADNYGGLNSILNIA